MPFIKQERKEKEATFVNEYLPDLWWSSPMFPVPFQHGGVPEMLKQQKNSKKFS